MAAKLHYRTLPFTVRAEDVAVDGSHFRGYAAVKNNIDEYGTIMGKGCFKRDLKYFRANGFIGGLNHNWDTPLGKPDEIEDDDRGLLVGGSIVDTAHGQDVRKLLKAGVIRKMSFGFEEVEKKFLDSPKDVEKYWEEAAYEPSDDDRERANHGAVCFTRVRVHEASPVMAPGNDRADITEIRQGEGKSYSTLEVMSLAVRDAVIDLCVRVEQLAELRALDGRSLSPERRAIIREIRERADKALAACQPKATLQDVAKLRRELYELQASVLD
jgi:HK97 family phage prohead protease